MVLFWTTDYIRYMISLFREVTGLAYKCTWKLFDTFELCSGLQHKESKFVNPTKHLPPSLASS